MSVPPGEYTLRPGLLRPLRVPLATTGPLPLPLPLPLPPPPSPRGR